MRNAIRARRMLAPIATSVAVRRGERIGSLPLVTSVHRRNDVVGDSVSAEEQRVAARVDDLHDVAFEGQDLPRARSVATHAVLGWSGELPRRLGCGTWRAPGACRR